MQPNYKTLILAAGFGTRLKKLGKDTAKGLFTNSQGLCITDLLITNLVQLEAVEEIALVSNGHFFNDYQTHIQTNWPNIQIEVLNDRAQQPENRLGSLGDLAFSLDQLNWWDQTVMVLPSDRTPGNILPQLIKTAQANPNKFIACFSEDEKENIKNRYGCAQLNNRLEVISFKEKPAVPKGNYRALPFYVFNPQSLALLKSYQQSGGNMDSPGNIIPWLIEQGLPVGACIITESSMDIGSLEELQSFQQASIT